MGRVFALTKIATAGLKDADQANGNLSDKDKIDRVAQHEELRFYKKQRWAVTTAAVVLLGAFLTTVSKVHVTALDKFFAVILISLAVCAGWFVLDNFQEGIVKVRCALDPADRDAAIRGREILSLHKSILVASAVVVGWAVLFKLPL
jgi:hypothetical protein